MRFVETDIVGAYLIYPELIQDDRGFFARTWCRQEFSERGLDSEMSQCSISYNKRCGTLRGMHYQQPPHSEVKLVRCTHGAIFDVIVDLRSDSPSQGRWFGCRLSSAERNALYVPAGCAHGFLTLEDDSEVLYQMSAPHHAESAAGVRWNDPMFGIRWPLAVQVISERDDSYPDYEKK